MYWQCLSLAHALKHVMKSAASLETIHDANLERMAQVSMQVDFKARLVQMQDLK